MRFTSSLLFFNGDIMECTEFSKKQTKNRRSKSFFLLICFLLCYLFLISYPAFDFEIFELSLNTIYFLTGIFGLVIGGLLIDVISGRKEILQKNIFLQILLSSLVIILWLLFAVQYILSSPPNFESVQYSDYLIWILRFSGSMFVAGIFIRLISFYTDEMVEKFKKV